MNAPFLTVCAFMPVLPVMPVLSLVRLLSIGPDAPVVPITTLFTQGVTIMSIVTKMRDAVRRGAWPSLTVAEIVMYTAYLLFVGYAVTVSSTHIGLTVTAAMLVGLGTGFKLGRK